MAKRRKKKLLPVTTPDASTLLALKNRMEKDVEIMERMGFSTSKDRKKYPLEELRKGVEWLTWLENEKRNEELRLARQEREEDVRESEEAERHEKEG